MENIEISREMALDIVNYYLNGNGFAQSKVEKWLLTKGIIDDIVPLKEFYEVISNLSNERLKEVLTLI